MPYTCIFEWRCETWISFPVSGRVSEILWVPRKIQINQIYANSEDPDRTAQQVVPSDMDFRCLSEIKIFALIDLVLIEWIDVVSYKGVNVSIKNSDQWLVPKVREKTLLMIIFDPRCEVWISFSIQCLKYAFACRPVAGCDSVSWVVCKGSWSS